MDYIVLMAPAITLPMAQGVKDQKPCEYIDTIIVPTMGVRDPLVPHAWWWMLV